MILKTSSLLYLFDLDGTLVGSNRWKGVISNSLDCFRFSHINPTRFDIRWSILTGRPIIDRLFINSVCKYHKLKPEKLFTLNTLFYHFKENKEVYDYKLNFIKNILDGVKKPFIRKITKILYVDNDLDCTLYLNQNKGQYNFLALNVVDFLDKNYSQILLD